ncbi:MAG TPA: hypothetical protein VKU00_12075 [Chthonomonadaceae bacterium]|nr:hypothetical protein [Chthonomonadaceae bacterium]
MIELTVPRDPAELSYGNSLAFPDRGTSLTIPTPEPMAQNVYIGSERWSHTRPEALVIACSDGRLQKSIDEFLEQRLGVVYYDRLYTPGGPGALATGGFELLRADQFRREFTFLRKAHAIQQVILLFHGASEDGPEDAVCAHYKRLMARASRPEIVQQQYKDMVEILQQPSLGWSQVRVHAFRADVHADASVHFVDLLGAKTP